MSEIKFDTIEEAIEDFKNGKPVIVADDEDRENEGDVIVPAQFATPQIINFLISQCKGVLCLALTREKAEKLGLSEMVSHSTDPKGTAFTQSIDAVKKYGVTTGVSAFDRAKTIEVAVANDSVASDLSRPGHVFPLIARKGGVLERVGHTEASVDLALLAGLTPAAVICEIVNEDGTMARRDNLVEFSKKHNLKFITVAQLIEYRLQKEMFMQRDAVANLPSDFGDFKVYGYTNKLGGVDQVAIVKDDGSDKIPMVRVHSECLTGDIFHSKRCDCQNQLEAALRLIENYGKGALVYIRGHEGRGIGLVNKIKAYALQEKGEDTVQANISLGFQPDLRNYGIGAQILRDLGYTKFKLITNNPTKIVALNGYGLEIVERIALKTPLNKYNERYIHTKVDKMEHLIDL
ncbi:TPA: bifunctional 3,4-dihydroxy-2-butanone-4-phosphate synthase/GTP cyclohydrolase II [Candidatus Avigastranaerophilus faecigallinarum]|nr:bifunctional 3,4-dihydroxy-2-butanone-4-phosphate synthase/GTP cyclohydrolase II [Candidatus Avigastranaerophilus faecigallinarum]